MMPEIRGITIAVGQWYTETLRVCLARNMRHLTECLVVTSPEDEAAQELAASVPGVRVHVTDAFTRYGARFNKGLGMEEGFDALGRDGWILIHDADCLFPDVVPLHDLDPKFLHGARRRILHDPSQWTPDFDWKSCPVSMDGGPIGYFQAFHADAIRDKRPWYDVTFAHAGGCDAYFMSLFGSGRFRILPIELLHLGPKDSHWFGCDPEAKEMMDAFILKNGWQRNLPRVDRAVAERVGEIPERVEVPGYPKSDFELPFVRRHRARQQRFR